MLVCMILDFDYNQGFEDLTDCRRTIDKYQLTQSQFVCSIAVFPHPQQLPIIYAVSTVYSETIIAMTTQVNEDDVNIRCAPRRGSCLGREEVLLVIPKFDRRRGLIFTLIDVFQSILSFIFNI